MVICRKLSTERPNLKRVINVCSYRLSLRLFSKEVSRRLANEDLSHIDYVFSWLGNMDLLLAIIKLLRTKLNVDDITEVGVQSILLVEDSVRFYSSVLPHIYKFLLKQSVYSRQRHSTSNEQDAAYARTAPK